MHVQIIQSQQAQADELDRARRRVTALEAQLRELGVEPTTESAYAPTEAAAARDFTHGNTHVSIRPGASAAPAATGPVTAAAKTQVGPPRQVKPQTQGGPQVVAQKATKPVIVADDAETRFALLELDDPPRR
jgi:hypothetical protein